MIKFNTPLCFKKKKQRAQSDNKHLRRLTPNYVKEER